MELQAHVGAIFAPAQGGILCLASRPRDRRRARPIRIRRDRAEFLGADDLCLLRSVLRRNSPAGPIDSVGDRRSIPPAS